MAEPLEIYADTFQRLGYDLPAAIDAYTLALASQNEDEPAPTSYALVEQIVREFDGQFVIVPNPPTQVSQPLPADPRYYKSKADQLAIVAQAAKAAGAAPPEVEPK